LVLNGKQNSVIEERILREAINEFLYGMTEGDFDILNKVGDIIARHLKSIGFEDEGALAEAINRAQMALARVVFEARTAGEASSAAWQELRDAIHDSTGDIERYIRLRMELTQAEENLAAIEQHRTEVMDELDEERFHMQMRHKEELRAADKKVQAAEEALQKFREETAEIPERFTRGRERQLQTELRAAQKERDSTRERHDIEMTQFEMRRHQIQETLDAQVEAAREVRDLLQKQVRWLEELIGTRLDLFESYDAEKSDLEDLSAVFEDMKRNVEDIFPSMAGLTDNFNKAKEAAEGLFSIWKAFWLGITGAPIDEVGVLTYDTVRMWEAGKKLHDAWDKFVGILDKVKTALQPILDLIGRIFGGEELELGIGEPLTLEGIIDGIIRWLDEGWPKVEAKLREWSEDFWNWVSEVIINLDKRLDPILDVVIFLIDAFILFIDESDALLRILAALTYLFMEVGARLLGVIGKIALDMAHGFIAKLAEHIGERWEQVETIVALKLAKLGADILKWIQSLPALLATALAEFVASVVQAFLDLYNELVGDSIVPDLINKIVEWFGRLPRAVWEKVDRMARDVVRRFLDLKNELLYTIVPELMNGIVTAVGTGVDQILAKFHTLKAKIIFYFMELRFEVVDWVSRMIADILGWFDIAQTYLIGGSIVPEMIEDIVTAFSGMRQAVTGEGVGMVTDLARGMAGQMPALHGALAGAGPMGGAMTGLNLTITNYWDSSISSKDRSEIQAATEETINRTLGEFYGGAA